MIARVPFDEGSLTGNLTKDSTWPDDDWRSTYFVPENLKSSVDHADALKSLIPSGMTMPEMAMRFILNSDVVSTIIPGMRKMRHVEMNIEASDSPDRLSTRAAREAQRLIVGTGSRPNGPSKDHSPMR